MKHHTHRRGPSPTVYIKTEPGLEPHTPKLTPHRPRERIEGSKASHPINISSGDDSGAENYSESSSTPRTKKAAPVHSETMSNAPPSSRTRRQSARPTDSLPGSSKRSEQPKSITAHSLDPTDQKRSNLSPSAKLITKKRTATTLESEVPSSGSTQPAQPETTNTPSKKAKKSLSPLSYHTAPLTSLPLNHALGPATLASLLPFLDLLTPYMNFQLKLADLKGRARDEVEEAQTLVDDVVQGLRERVWREERGKESLEERDEGGRMESGQSGGDRFLYGGSESGESFGEGSGEEGNY
ncbi:hypothetical protein B0J11DRAFT_500279 [Dendryphion nanum]|uniref:Uncharacterized protein n=1 Tax=Dendryphion nanum TaxID=256645 RepID=A0A9P9EGX4_9PLEO|nr:hypothetical protein B0J11DRAFT_500279 [Dendryphion nanum]